MGSLVFAVQYNTLKVLGIKLEGLDTDGTSQLLGHSTQTGLEGHLAHLTLWLMFSVVSASRYIHMYNGELKPSLRNLHIGKRGK